MELLKPLRQEKGSSGTKREQWSIKVGNQIAEKAARGYLKTADRKTDLSNYISFDWDKMDAIFEEGEEVYVHAHDPYHRIDTLCGSSHIEIVVAGEKVADSRNPVVLF